jgi:tRNA(fMet)-specific endonuclease VapC
MADYLLDTNHVTHLLGGSETLLRRIAEMMPDAVFGISMTVLGELYYAAHASQRRDDNLRSVRTFAADSVVWPYDEAAAEEFGLIQAEQKAKGRPIPSADAQIAAVARLRGLIVLSADHHFEFVKNLTVENWLV